MGNQDMKFVTDNILMGKKFCNKIWNATRIYSVKISDAEITVPKKAPKA